MRLRPGWSACVLVLVVLAGVARAEGTPRPMTVNDVMKIRNVVEARLSPDGSRVVYVVSEVDFKEGFYNTDLWLVSAGGGAPRRLTAGPRRDDTPRWAPDGKGIAFLSDRGGSVQVWLIAADGGEARKLSD